MHRNANKFGANFQVEKKVPDFCLHSDAGVSKTKHTFADAKQNMKWLFYLSTSVLLSSQGHHSLPTFYR